MKDKQCHAQIVRARTALLVSQPFFGCLALHMKLVEVTDQAFCDTMAVDGTHMFYWPPFVKKLADKELEGVVAHEVMHCVYKHMTRRKNRDPLRWNWAGDFVINSDLLKAGFTLPGTAITLKSPPDTKGHLYDPQYDGMSTEEIYERLPEPPKVYVTGGGMGQGKGGGGEPDPNGQGGLPKGADWGGCGGVIDADGGNAEKRDQIDRDWEATTRMAVGVARRANAGTLPGYLQRLVNEMRKPIVTWRDETNDFIDTCMKSDFSWARPSRRGMAQGMILPGYFPDALNHLLFVIDNSGSITDRIIESYLGEISGALDDGVADRLTVVYCDAAVNHVDEYLPGDLVTYNSKEGGGGTDFRPAFEWAQENAPDANCIVYLTDMLPSTWELPEMEAPVLWAAYLPAEMLMQIHPPFGRVIHVDSGD